MDDLRDCTLIDEGPRRFPDAERGISVDVGAGPWGSDGMPI